MVACTTKKGDLLPVNAPRTSLFVDTIILDSADRLKTKVHLRWEGYSKDDYIAGYKILYSFSPIVGAATKFDTITKVTTKTDSVFQFTIPRGSNLGNLYFSVQAITSKGAKDLNPPVLLVPIINTPPTSKWDKGNLPLNDTVLSVLTLPFNIDDFDGSNTIDTVEVRANFSTWVSIPKTSNLICLVANNPMQVGTQEAKVYSADGKTVLPFTIPGVNVGDFNRFEVRAIDASGAKSKVDTTAPIYLKPQTSDLLVIEAYYSESLEGFYRTTITNSVYTQGFDFISLTANGGIDKPKIWSPTIDVLLKQYKKILWYNDAKNSPDGTTSPLLLNTAYVQLKAFERNGGKLIVSCPFPKAAEAISGSAPVFSLIPVNVSAFSGGNAFSTQVARLNGNRSIVSKYASAGYPALLTGSVFSNIDPFIPTADSDTLYTSAAINNYQGNYTGSKIIAVKRTGIQGTKTSMVYFSVELQKLNGDLPALQSMFSQILNNEFRQ